MEQSDLNCESATGLVAKTASCLLNEYVSDCNKNPANGAKQATKVSDAFPGRNELID